MENIHILKSGKAMEVKRWTSRC